MGADAYTEDRRLHPMTLLQRLIVSIPGFLILLLPFLRSPDQDAWISLVLTIVFGFIAIPLIILRYVRFRYRITRNEILIQSGVVTRRSRSIPIERVHNIEIEQGLLQRLFGTAKVKIETAGSTSTEGVLEYVSLKEAQSIRQMVRAFQREQRKQNETESDIVEVPVGTDVELAVEPAEEDVSRPPVALFSMSLKHTLLSGVYRFSLLYIVLFFSGLQYLDIDPEDIIDWVQREQFQEIARFAETSPWLTALISIMLAAFLSWISGIAVNLNKYYGFHLGIEGDKLHKKRGLLTVSETTIPIKKVQAIILRSNPLMNRFGWWQLQVQTLGIHEQQKGYEVIAPFARMHEVEKIVSIIHDTVIPEHFNPVSRLHVRRLFIRYGFLTLLAVLSAANFWLPSLWGLIAVPLTLIVAILAYRKHGYQLDEVTFFVKRGILQQYIWIIPIEKCQAFTTTATIFQQRLNLKSFHVDTAGAGSFAYPEVIDVPADEADRRISELYDRFQVLSRQQRREKAGVIPPSFPEENTDRDKVRSELFFEEPDPEDREQSS